MAKRDNTVAIEVVDEGVGFKKSTDNKRATESNKSGFGLHNITRRLKLFGGALEIDRKRKRGTKIIVTAPLQ